MISLLRKLNVFIIIILSIFNTTILKSQNDPSSIINDQLDINKTVAVIPFSTSFDYDAGRADYSRMLTERVQTAIEQTKRFIMVERMDLEKILGIIRSQDENSQEYKYWKDIENNHLVEAGRQLGVEYIFTGNLSNDPGSILLSGGYGANLGFTVKVISVETGKLYVTQSFNEGSDKIIGKGSKEEALDAALEKIVKPVQKFIDKNFPLEVPFYAVDTKNRKGIPKTIVIKGGVENGLRKDQKLDIALIGNGDYRERIGEVKIIGPESHYSICKIIKGHKEIQKQIEANPVLIIAKSKAY